jgi:hypothetical protein
MQEGGADSRVEDRRFLFGGDTSGTDASFEQVR